jgi:hypothetical protein
MLEIREGNSQDLFFYFYVCVCTWKRKPLLSSLATCIKLTGYLASCRKGVKTEFMIIPAGLLRHGYGDSRNAVAADSETSMLGQPLKHFLTQPMPEADRIPPFPDSCRGNETTTRIMIQRKYSWQHFRTRRMLHNWIGLSLGNEDSQTEPGLAGAPSSSFGFRTALDM